MVSQPPFQRLGLDARINGPANATWTKGDCKTVVVSATLDLSPSMQLLPAKLPISGSVDAIYRQRTAR